MALALCSSVTLPPNRARFVALSEPLTPWVTVPPLPALSVIVLAGVETALLIARLPLLAVSVTGPPTLMDRSIVRSPDAVALTLPVPPMPPAFEAIVLSATLPERLNTNAALLVTTPLPNVPVLPPLPTASVPADTVVVPA